MSALFFPNSNGHLTYSISANATRYLTVIGLAILIYDHILTLRSEWSLIWRAPPSFAKYAFLLNRYLVPGCMTAAIYQMSLFTYADLTTSGCQVLLLTLSLLSICSIAMANGLVLMRVMLLWGENRTAKRLLGASFMLSTLCTFTAFILAMWRMLLDIQFSPYVQMCVPTRTSRWLIATWASPILFDLFTLLTTVYNTLSRPRDAHVPLRKALARDGISFFIGLVALRILNLSLAATLDPSLTMLAVFFVWSCITTLLNRSLLRLRKAELDSDAADAPGLTTGRSSPFGVPFKE